MGMRIRILKLFLVVALVATAGWVAWPRINFFLLTGHFFPIRQVERLDHPITVNGWTRNGLNLADGRIVQLPGLKSLPTNSEALAQATQRGVEIDSTGRIWGLVKIHHWCGNDPVREDVKKIDLGDMMTFLQVGEPVGPVITADYIHIQPGGQFSQYGWNINDFLEFLTWKVLKADSEARDTR